MGQYGLMKLDIQRFAASGSVSCTTLSQDIGSNSSVVRITFTVRRTSGSTYWSDNKTATINCDGQTKTASIKLPSNVTSSSCYADFTVGHAADGTKTVSFSASVYPGSSIGTISASGSATLATIPRYANITSFSVSMRNETSVQYNWAADAVCDYAWYSLDGSNWYDLPNSGVVGGLSSGTQYGFYLRVRRTDSQLTSTAGPVYQSTYYYPHVTGCTSANIGNPITVYIYNPLGRTYTLQLISTNNNQVVGTYTGSSTTDVTGFADAGSQNAMYASIPNSTQGQYRTKLVSDYGTHEWDSRGYGNYYVDTNTSKPDFNLFTWEDINPTTLALTGDNSAVIKNYSNIQATIPVANKATPNNYASIIKYEFACGDKTSQDPMAYSSNEDVTGTITGVPSNTFKVRAVDSRGLNSGYVELSALDFIDYTPLAKTSGSVHRVGEVSEQVELSFEAQIDLEDFGDVTNSIKSVTYGYKLASDANYTTGETVITPTVGQDGKVTFTGYIKGDKPNGFDVSNVYSIRLTVEDELSSISWEFTLQSGTPHLAWHKDGLSVMQKYDETLGGAFQVNGVRRDGVYSTEEQKIGYWTDKNGTTKPLYRKTIYSTVSFSASSTMVAYTVAHNIDNVETIMIDAGHSYCWSSGEGVFYPVTGDYIVNGSVYVSIRSAVGTYGIQCQIMSIYGGSQDFCWTIEYTKTTNTPVSL